MSHNNSQKARLRAFLAAKRAAGHDTEQVGKFGPMLDHFAEKRAIAEQITQLIASKKDIANER